MPSMDSPSTDILDPEERKTSPTELSGRTLGLWNAGRIFTSFGSVILSLVPIFFIGKHCYNQTLDVTNSLTFKVVAIIAASLNHKPTSVPYGSDLERLLILLPTLFPIAFAAIMGRFFKTVGLYWAERGVSLGVRCPQLQTMIEC